MEARELPKHPHPPRLSADAVAALTSLCFRHDDPAPAALILVFSTHTEPELAAARAAELLRMGFSRTLVLTGGTSHGLYPDVPATPDTEAGLVHSALPPNLLRGLRVVIEDRSTNLRDNARFALRDFLAIESLIFVTKAHAAGRSYATLRRLLPNARLYQATYAVTYPHSPGPLTAANWHHTPSGCERVWGEYQRLLAYGHRGDIDTSKFSALLSRVHRSIRLEAE